MSRFCVVESLDFDETFWILHRIPWKSHWIFNRNLRQNPLMFVSSSEIQLLPPIHKALGMLETNFLRDDKLFLVQVSSCGIDIVYASGISENHLEHL